MSQMLSAWKNLPSMASNGNCVATTLNGKLYVVSAKLNESQEDFEGSIQSFDINEQQWTQISSRMRASFSCCSAAAIGNSIYMAGGEGFSPHHGDFPLNSVEAFDVKSGLYRTLPSMSSHRDGCAAVAVGDEMFVFGGYNWRDDELDTAESLNVKTEQWEDLPPMNTRRSGCAAAAIENKIYVVGGHNGMECLDTVEVFDVAMRTWELLPHRMTTKRSSCAAAAVGKYLVVSGGYHDRGDENPYQNIVEMYDTKSEMWITLPPMATKRAGCAAVAWGGSVYVIGGNDSHVAIDSVEELQFNDDVLKQILLEWSGGSWSSDVAPLLHRRTPIVHKMDVDVALMPTLLSSVGWEGRLQLVFEIVRGDIGIFQGIPEATAERVQQKKF